MPTSFDLDGKIALVTGGSGAIGQAVMHALHAAGARALSFDLVAPKNCFQALFSRLLGVEADRVIVWKFSHADFSRSGCEIAFGLVHRFTG